MKPRYNSFANKGLMRNSFIIGSKLLIGGTYTKVCAQGSIPPVAEHGHARASKNCTPDSLGYTTGRKTDFLRWPQVALGKRS